MAVGGSGPAGPGGPALMDGGMGEASFTEHGAEGQGVPGLVDIAEATGSESPTELEGGGGLALLEAPEAGRSEAAGPGHALDQVRAAIAETPAEAPPNGEGVTAADLVTAPQPNVDSLNQIRAAIAADPNVLPAGDGATAGSMPEDVKDYVAGVAKAWRASQLDGPTASPSESGGEASAVSPFWLNERTEATGSLHQPSEELKDLVGYQGFMRKGVKDGRSFEEFAEIAQNELGSWEFKTTIAYQDGEIASTTQQVESREAAMKQLEKETPGAEYAEDDQELELVRQ